MANTVKSIPRRRRRTRPQPDPGGIAQARAQTGFESRFKDRFKARSKSKFTAQPPINSHRRSQTGSTGKPLASQWRLWLIWILLMAMALGLLARLAQLQLIQGSELRQQAAQQHLITSPPPPARRAIVDRQGQLLAVDRVRYTLYGHPALFQHSPEAIATALSPWLEQPADTLAAQLRAYDTGIPLGRDLSSEVAQQIRQLRFDGLELVSQSQRFYPQGDLYGPIVGFVNLEGEAQSGLELTQASHLALTLPRVAQLPEAVMPVGNVRLESPTQLQLTLDSRLQRVAQTALEETLAEFNAKRGTVMVMDVETGALRALALTPTFDPNRYYDTPLEALGNWTVTDFYEPGSTLKPINVAIALEAEAIQPTTTVYDEGQIQVDDWTIQNADYESFRRSGTLTLSQVMQYSSNVGMVHLMEKMPATEFYDWLQQLGFGAVTGIDLPGEVPAPLKSRDQFLNSRVDSATVAFGQGIVMTPIKLLQLYGAVANGGKLITPHVVQGLVDETGALRWRPLRAAPTPLFSAETSETVLSTLEAVVRDGTGKVAQIPGYRIGGKTGTAQKVTAWGGYGDGRITSFVGILPADAPRFVVLAVIDEPQGDNAYGSTVAAPLVKTVMTALIRLEGIPPEGADTEGNLWVVSPPTEDDSATDEAP